MTNRIFEAANLTEERSLEVYELLKEICADPSAAPCVRANAQKALACMWQVVNDLGLVHEQLFELGV